MTNRRRAVRRAGTVGGDAPLRHVLPAVQQETVQREAAPDPARATSGTAPTRDGTALTTGGDHPATASRAADDTDHGWGEPPDRSDEHLLRERPPHW
ncbi:MAG: hypothetical protein FWD18_01125 [Micrococcales bacterium]|nr:hypothetical protein [Micrococcales bacterium]